MSEAAERVDLLGTWIDNVSRPEALERLSRLIEAGEPSYVVTPNVDHLVKLKRDPEFRRVYEQAALVLADGIPLLWAARLLGTPLKAKVSGSDLFVEFARYAAARGYRLFYLGGRPGAAEAAAERLRARFPGLQVVGTYCPPMGFHQDPAENGRTIDRVREVKPDVLFVGLGAPKQELWIARHRDELGVPVSIGVGASFDFVSGQVRRAPEWMQRVGLEWSWRLMKEPRRMWRRYLVDDSRFFVYLAAQLREQRRLKKRVGA